MLLRGLVRLASRARQLVRLRAAAAASTTSCLARPQLRGRESRLSKRCFAWHDRLAQGCLSLFARAGLPWHAEPICALPVGAFTRIKPLPPLFTEVYIPVPYLWYLKGSLWRCRSYDFQAPGLPTTPTLSAPRRLLLLRIFRLVAVTTRWAVDQQTRSDANAGRAQIEKLKCGLSARKSRGGHAEGRLYLQRGPASAAQRANT